MAEEYLWFEEWKDWSGVELHGQQPHGAIFHGMVDGLLEEEWTFYQCPRLADGSVQAVSLPDAGKFTDVAVANFALRRSWFGGALLHTRLGGTDGGRGCNRRFATLAPKHVTPSCSCVVCCRTPKTPEPLQGTSLTIRRRAGLSAWRTSSAGRRRSSAPSSLPTSAAMEGTERARHFLWSQCLSLRHCG